MDEKLKDVYRLADSGQVVAAIKLYRELTGAGLAEAKAYVDSYLAGDLGNSSGVEKEDRMPEIMSLIRADRSIEAIKVYREFTGCGLAEAKAAVDKLKAGENKATATTNRKVCPACGCSAVTEKTRKILFLSKKYLACMNCGYEIE